MTLARGAAPDAAAPTNLAAAVPRHAACPVSRWWPTERAWLGLHASALALATVVALTPGAPSGARVLLALDLHPPPGDLTGAAGIFAHNLAVLAPLLLAPRLVAAPAWPRGVIRVYRAWVVGWAVVTVGGAVGAYGPSLLTHLVHVPVEWAALVIAVAPPPTAARSRWRGVVALLAAAALLEAFV